MYGSDPLGVLSWRFLVDQAGHGVTTDLMSHSVDLAHMLLGPITRVVGTTETFIRERPLPGAGRQPLRPRAAGRPDRRGHERGLRRDAVRVRLRRARDVRDQPLDRRAREPERVRGLRHQGRARRGTSRSSTSCSSTSSRTSSHTGYRTVLRRRPVPVPRPLRAGQRERHRVRGPRRDRGLRVLPLASPRAASTAPASATRSSGSSVQAALLRSAAVGPVGGRRLATGGVTHGREQRTAHGPRPRRRRRRPCASASSASGGSAGCTPSCSPAGSRAATLAASSTPAPRARPGRRRRASACRSPARWRRCSPRRTSTPSRSARAPTRTRDLIVEAARAGKAIFCEKPVSLDLETVDRALAAVEAAGVPFQIGFNRRFDPAHASVRAAVAAGRVGDPHLVRITSRDPAPPPIEYVRVSGGIFLDMTIHDFDMARYVTGSEVVEVYARGAVRVDPSFGEAGDVDTAMVMLVARERLPDVDRQLAARRLRLRPARRGVRVARAWPRARTRSRTPASCASAEGTREADAAVLLPRALHRELRARVGGVRRRARRRRDAAGHDGRRARAARHRPRRVALAARGPAGPHRRGRRRDVDAERPSTALAAGGRRREAA